VYSAATDALVDHLLAESAVAASVLDERSPHSGAKRLESNTASNISVTSCKHHAAKNTKEANG